MEITGAPTQTLYVANVTPLLFLILTVAEPLLLLLAAVIEVELAEGFEMLIKLLLLFQEYPDCQLVAEKVCGELEQINGAPLITGGGDGVVNVTGGVLLGDEPAEFTALTVRL